MLHFSVYFSIFLVVITLPYSITRGDTSPERQAAKIIHMYREVLFDMIRKIETLSIIKHKWQMHRRFQLGEAVFEVRKRYAILRRLLKRNLDYDPKTKEYSMKTRKEMPKKDFLSIRDMSKSQQIQLEIDQLTLQVEKYEWARLNSSNMERKFAYPLRRNMENEDENVKAILRSQMKNKGTHNNEVDLKDLVDTVGDISKENLMRLIKKIGDVPKAGIRNTKNNKRGNLNGAANARAKHEPSKHQPEEPLESESSEAW